MKKNLVLILILFISVCFQSCVTLKLSERKGKDILLNDSCYNFLNGTYTNQALIDTNLRLCYLINSKENLSNKNLKIKLDIIDKSTLSLIFLKGDSICHSSKLKGQLQNGYFVATPKRNISFPLGPILWGPGTFKYCFGLTNEKNLVVIESHGGVAILVVLPFFASGGERFGEFKRLSN